MGLARNQYAVLVVLAGDAIGNADNPNASDWVGRTAVSIVGRIQHVGESTIYNAIRTLIKDGLIKERYHTHPTTGRVVRILSITPLGNDALLNERDSLAALEKV